MVDAPGCEECQAIGCDVEAAHLHSRRTLPGRAWRHWLHLDRLLSGVKVTASAIDGNDLQHQWHGSA